MDMNVTVTLLAVAVGLLSLIIIGLLVAVIVVLVKVRQLAKNVNVLLANVASATEWFSPAKIFHEAVRIFRK